MELELWPNDEYGIRSYSFQKKSLRVQLTVTTDTELEMDQGL